MSCCVVNDKTISSVLNFWSNSCGNENRKILNDLDFKIGLDILSRQKYSNESQLVIIGQIILDENHKAFNCNYKVNYKIKKSENEKFYYFKNENYSNVFQCLKAIDYIQYQINVSHDSEESPAYKILNSIRKAIIKVQPQYLKAIWG